MEVKHPVVNLKLGLELMVLILIVLAPLALIALAGTVTHITLGLIIAEIIGTLIWWYASYVAFWLFIS